MFKLPAPHHRFPRSTVLTVPGTYSTIKISSGKCPSPNHIQAQKMGSRTPVPKGSRKKYPSSKKSHHNSFQQNIPPNRAICHKYLRRMRAKCGVKSVSRRQFSTRSVGTLCRSFFSKTFLRIGLSQGREEKNGPSLTGVCGDYFRRNFEASTVGSVCFLQTSTPHHHQPRSHSSPCLTVEQDISFKKNNHNQILYQFSCIQLHVTKLFNYIEVFDMRYSH